MNSIYQRVNGGFILVSQDVLKFLNKFKQYNGDTEAGGILLGCYRGTHIEITHATPPGLDDIRQPLKFIRKCSSHANEAIRVWKSSQEKITYLGEWHTHPQAIPVPSVIDHNNWRNKLPNGDCVLCIQGTERLWVGEKLSNTKDTHEVDEIK